MSSSITPRRSPEGNRGDILDRLPSDLARFRVMGVAETAAFFNYSIPHFRRLYRKGKVPQPIKIGERKLGWRMGDCIDFLQAQQTA